MYASSALAPFFYKSVRTLLERELEAVGIRLNKKKPNIYFKVSSFFLFPLCLIVVVIRVKRSWWMQAYSFLSKIGKYTVNLVNSCVSLDSSIITSRLQCHLIASLPGPSWSLLTAANGTVLYVYTPERPIVGVHTRKPHIVETSFNTNRSLKQTTNICSFELCCDLAQLSLSFGGKISVSLFFSMFF